MGPSPSNWLAAHIADHGPNLFFHAQLKRASNLSCSDINVKMPTITIVGILTFISMINMTSEGLKANEVFIF